MSTPLCPLCNRRRARRSCPALGKDICAVCCGTKRLVEISCPPSCSYLSSSRAHPPAVVQRRQERDFGFLLPNWADLTEAQHRLLLLFQSVTLKHAGEALPPIVDDDVAQAAAATAATLETAGKGIIYQHQASSLPAQRLATEFGSTLQELSRTAGGTLPRQLERDAVTVLRRLEQMARRAAHDLPEDEPPVLLKLLARAMDRAGAAKQDDDREETPRLIIPGQ